MSVRPSAMNSSRSEGLVINRSAPRLSMVLRSLGESERCKYDYRYAGIVAFFPDTAKYIATIAFRQIQIQNHEVGGASILKFALPLNVLQGLLAINYDSQIHFLPLRGSAPRGEDRHPPGYPRRPEFS